jgi:hypothetical protein
MRNGRPTHRLMFRIPWLNFGQTTVVRQEKERRDPLIVG